MSPYHRCLPATALRALDFYSLGLATMVVNPPFWGIKVKDKIDSYRRC